MSETSSLDEVLSDEVKQKREWFDYYEKHEKNARLTCRHFGISPDTFYRWKRRFDPNNLSSLEDNKKNRRPKNLREPTTPLRVVGRIKIIKETHPAWSNSNILTQLKNEGVSISCATIGRIINKLKSSGLLHRNAATIYVNKRREKSVQSGHESPRGYNEYLSLLKMWKE